MVRALALALVFLASFSVGVFVVAVRKDRENRRLKGAIGAMRNAEDAFIRHAEETSAIRRERGGIDREIREAKGDDEVLAVVNSIIAANNARVRDGGGRGGPSAKP